MVQRVIQTTRTPLDEAVKEIFKLLVESEKSYSMTSLARESHLHRKTVQKSIELLSTLEKYLEDYRLTLREVDNRKIITLERRVGLLSYPEEVQKFIIKSKYFPMPSEETYVMLHLYLRDAISREKAVPLEGKENEMKKLIKQEKINQKGATKYYLSDEGITIAKGALKIYPELEQQRDQLKHRNKDT